VGSNLGANGDQEYFGYGTTASAVSDVQAIGLKLAACTSASYDVHNVTLSDGHVVSVAAATGDQGAVVWMAQQGPIVMYVVVPAGQTPPPDSVSRAVGGLLYGLIDHPQASSGNGTPVQSETPATKVVKQHATARSSSN
jgi:hypothetical protein